MFSEREQKILDILGEREMTLGDIALKLFKIPTMDQTIKVNNSISRINSKCMLHNKKWFLNKIRKDRKLLVTKEKR